MWYSSETNYNHCVIKNDSKNIYYYVRGNSDFHDMNEIKNTANIIENILNSGKNSNKLKKLYRPDTELLMFTNKCQLGCSGPVSKASSSIEDMKNPNGEIVFNPERKEAIDYISKKLS
jgi:hypothetical protein